MFMSGKLLIPEMFGLKTLILQVESFNLKLYCDLFILNSIL